MEFLAIILVVAIFVRPVYVSVQYMHEKYTLHVLVVGTCVHHIQIIGLLHGSVTILSLIRMVEFDFDSGIGIMLHVLSIGMEWR